MRKLQRLAATCLALSGALAATAHAQVGEGGVSSPNVEWIEHHADTVGVAEGGRLVGSTFFLTNNNQGLFAFDVSEPEHPRKLGQLVLPHAAENEDVATNGRILLLSQLGDVYHLTDGAAQQGTILNVVDVRDPANMKVIAKVDARGDHTWDCVLDAPRPTARPASSWTCATRPSRSSWRRAGATPTAPTAASRSRTTSPRSPRGS